MASSKFPIWRRERNNVLFPQGPCTFFLIVTIILLALGFMAGSYDFCRSSVTEHSQTIQEQGVQRHMRSKEFDCMGSLQTGPVVAQKVEKVRRPFFISIADLGTIEKPNRNFQRILKGKLFQKPDISETVQSILEKAKANGLDAGRSLIVDVGANVGMATFAATTMGYNVIAFEPVFENVLKICDGIYFNRASSLVQLYNLAVSDSPGHITMHKVVGRLDNTAVSATGARLAFKSNEVVPVTIEAVTLDSMIPTSSRVLLLKIDVQGWEYHVLKGASKLLSRPPHEAPYVIYEEDEKLLRESNSTSGEILQFLVEHGYLFCIKNGGDRHCSKVSGNFGG